MSFLNIQLSGLSGRHHPALSGIKTTRDVQRLRPHIKMLSGDYLTYSRIAQDNKGVGDPSCRICRTSQPVSVALVPPDTVLHILTECRGTAEVRERLYPELLNLLLTVDPNDAFLASHNEFCGNNLAQFLLDCTSFNLPEHIRISHSNPRLSDIFRFSRDFCFAIHSCRMTKLKLLVNK